MEKDASNLFIGSANDLWIKALTIGSNATFGQCDWKHPLEWQTYQLQRTTQKKGGILIASIEKHGGDTLYYIKHNMRELPPDKTPSNLEIDEIKKNQNYSIISRGKNATEINRYRKQITKEIFKYNYTQL